MTVHTPEQSARRVATAPQLYRSIIESPARFAVVRNASRPEQVEAYLPSNYALMESFVEERPGGRQSLVVIVGGHDVAGWTLDGYVIPRLGSGLYVAEEIPA